MQEEDEEKREEVGRLRRKGREEVRRVGSKRGTVKTAGSTLQTLGSVIATMKTESPGMKRGQPVSPLLPSLLQETSHQFLTGRPTHLCLTWRLALPGLEGSSMRWVVTGNGSGVMIANGILRAGSGGSLITAGFGLLVASTMWEPTSLAEENGMTGQRKDTKIGLHLSRASFANTKEAAAV